VSQIKGKAFVLGHDIDTDQIIPANHLVLSLDDPEERKLYGAYALSGVPEAQSGLPGGKIPFVNQGQNNSIFSIVIAGSNFGCGSSREHAPVALQMAGVRAVIAPSYARIFYRNAVDGGYLIPFESETDLSAMIRTGDEVAIDSEAGTLMDAFGKIHRLRPLGEVKKIVEAGGIFDYAKSQGMLG
jgi:3-isopropylmalate/(R)-2-methylmalate dehydratase small subunit